MPTYDELQIEIKTNGPRTQKVKCPVCSHNRKNRSDKSLSVNLDKGIYNCHYCGWKGCVYDKPDYVEKKAYAKPDPIELPLLEATINWFSGRGIQAETLQYFRVSESREWMPERNEHNAGQRNCINFNYFRNGEKVNIKYRDSLKCFRMTKDAELILYNLDALKDRKDMIICEGEIDCMTLYQSGHYGAVSVPNGASKGSARLEYLDNCSGIFDQMEKIIIAVDGDEAGTFLRNELARRLGKHRCWFVDYPEGCKDANEVLLKYGPEAVRTLWQSAIAPALESVLTIEELRPELDDIYFNGWPKSDPIGYDFFDQLLCFQPSEVTTVTGIPGHGKGEWVDQVTIRLAARHGRKVGIFSYEEPPKIKAIKLSQKFIGLPYYRKDVGAKMNLAQRDAALRFIHHHFYFIDIATADLSIDGILNKGRELVLAKGIDVFVIDPYNCIETRREAWQSETEYVSEVMRKIKQFSVDCKVHVFLVAHPTKMRKDKNTGKYEVPTLYDIAGSANFFNKTDNGMCVYRNYQENTADVYVQKVKFFFNGKLGFQPFNFDLPTGRYAEVGGFDESELEYQQKRMVQTELPLQPTSSSSSSESILMTSMDEIPDNAWTEPLNEEDVPF